MSWWHHQCWHQSGCWPTHCCSRCLCLQWKHTVKPNTVWSLSLSTTMQPCRSACCGVHWGVWWVVHHQWFVACHCWGWAALVLVSMIVASTHVPLSKSSQTPSPSVPISCPWTPLGGHQCLMTSKHSVICGDWWRGFSIHWCLDAFPLLFFTVNADSFEL